jgi:hypothetical protein
MGIEIRQPGEAKAAAEAGKQIGAAEGRKRAENIALQQAAEQRARQWELEKMQIRSQQDFAHEVRMRQAQLDAEARAKEWEVEKMELRSRIDFSEKEKERQRKMGIGRARVDAIDKAFERNEFSRDDVRVKEQRDYWQYMADTGESAPASLYSGEKMTTLSPVEQSQAERIKAGLLPRATAPKDPLKMERDFYDEMMGPDITGISDIFQLRKTWDKQAREVGLDPDKTREDWINRQSFSVLPQYQIGQIVTKGGQEYRIISLKPDGTPDEVEIVK